MSASERAETEPWEAAAFAVLRRLRAVEAEVADLHACLRATGDCQECGKPSPCPTALIVGVRS